MQGWQALLGILLFVYLIQVVAPDITPMFYFDSPLLQPWVFVTSCFLHGSFMHLFFNCFALLIFGPYLEREIGTRNFLMLFILAGIAGNITYYLTIVMGIIPPIPALGASGGIFGILGALAVIKPNMRIFLFFIPMSIQTAAVVWFVLELVGSFNVASGIASAAHLGGLIFGVLYGKLYRHKEKEASFDPGRDDFGLYENQENKTEDYF